MGIARCIRIPPVRAEKYLRKGRLSEWAANLISPALPIVDAIWGVTTESVKDDPSMERYLRPIPLVGPLLYNWFGGGAEKYNERMEKARRER